MKVNNNHPASSTSCSLLIKATAEDNHIYHFDDSWNLSIDGFKFTKSGDDRVKVNFSFQAQLHQVDDKGNLVTVIGDKNMDEIQPFLEKLESLLDILTLYTDVPLVIDDGSFVISGAGMSTLSNPVTNTLMLHDLSGLGSRYSHLQTNEDLSNAVRFFRLSLIDKKYSGKAVKLWAALESLYKEAKDEVPTIWSQMEVAEKQKLDDLINTFNLEEDLKDRLRGAIKYQKTLSDKDVLSRKVKLMNESGDISQNNVRKLIKWWSEPRNISAHGRIIRRDDVDRKEAVEDLENTLKMLLQSGISPSMHAYFIGHPKDVDQDFWDENDSTITKKTEDCWIKPTPWGTYLLENMRHHKVGDNMPMLYVSHDKVYELSRKGNTEVLDTSILPTHYQEAVKKVQKKLNKTV